MWLETFDSFAFEESNRIMELVEVNSKGLYQCKMQNFESSRKIEIILDSNKIYSKKKNFLIERFQLTKITFKKIMIEKKCFNGKK